jgi:hypothetical protein
MDVLEDSDLTFLEHSTGKRRVPSPRRTWSTYGYSSAIRKLILGSWNPLLLLLLSRVTTLKICLHNILLSIKTTKEARQQFRSHAFAQAPAGAILLPMAFSVCRCLISTVSHFLFLCFFLSKSSSSCQGDYRYYL